MADPRNAQSASRLSEDIGDVLNAIRRMIAEDDALSSARERLIAERDALNSLVQEDAGEFLARRYGGNAALARRLAGVAEAPEAAAQDASEIWPFGDRANAADAARPATVSIEAPQQDTAQPPRNNLARILSAGVSEPVPTVDDTAPEPAAPRGWRAWIAPEPRMSRWASPEAAGEAATDAAAEFEAIVSQDDFDEGLDWKSRMRPDLDEVRASGAIADDAQDKVLSSEAAAVAEDHALVPRNDPPQVVNDPAPQPAYLTPEFSSAWGGYQTLFSIAGLPSGILDAPADPKPTATIGAEPSAPAEPAALLLSDPQIVPEAADMLADAVDDQPLDDEEASIRDLLREMIQEELHGAMGERFSGNIRAVIRREVAAAIDQHLER